MPGRSVAPRANLIAASTHSAPEFAKKDFIQVGHVFQQPFGQHTRQRRNVQLYEIGQVAIEDTLQGLAQRRMIAAYRKNAKSAE